MDRLNLMHKLLVTSVAALFIINQALLDRAQQEVYGVLPERRIKNEVLRRGELAGVILTLPDGREIDGHIGRITETGFTLIGDAGGNCSELAFRDAKEVRASNSDQGLVEIGLTTTAQVIESLGQGIREWKDR